MIDLLKKKLNNDGIISSGNKKILSISKLVGQ